MSESTIDLVALKRLLSAIGGDPDDLAELVEDYSSDAPTLVAKMREAGSAGDWDAMRIAAHSLKSNARDFGATRLSKLSEALEHACRAGPIDQPELRVAEIEAEETAARSALAAIRIEDVGDL